MDSPDAQVASWHWPSSVSPLVDVALLEEIRKRDSPLYFPREYLAEWPDEAGSYFPAAELESAVADYELLPPERARGDLVVAGLDFGFSVDANALVLVGVLDDGRSTMIGTRMSGSSSCPGWRLTTGCRTRSSRIGWSTLGTHRIRGAGTRFGIVWPS